MRNLLLLLLFFSVSLYGSDKEHITSMHEEAYTLLDNEYDQAFEIGVKTENLAHNAGLIYEEANSIFIQAWVLQNKKYELGKSFILYLKALEVIKESYSQSDDSRKLYLFLLNNTGDLLRDHYAYDAATNYYDKAIDIAKDAVDYQRLARLYWNKSNLLMKRDKSIESLDLIEEAVTYAKVSGNEELILGTINQKGINLVKLNQFDAAIKVFDYILNHTYSEIEEFKYKSYALHNIGHAYFSKKDMLAAITAYEKAYEYKSKHTELTEQFITLADLTEAYLAIEDYEKAKEYSFKALEIYPDVQLIPRNYKIFEFLSSVSFEQGQYSKSREYTKKYITENDKFLELQEELQRTKDQYKMELLAAGFFTEVNASKDESMYNILLTIITSIFTLVLVAGITGQYLVRRSVKKSIQEIESEHYNFPLK